MFEGYLELGGGEVLNSARSLGYTKTADCPVSWLVCPPCEGVASALGDTEYTFANISEAPWYDTEDEVTHRFMGAHGISIEGLPDSTREATVAEGILDGGVVGRVRKATRRMRVRAMLSAIGEDALEAGFSWLESALTPGRCGTHGDACGAADMRVWAACPPEPTEFTKPELIWNDPNKNLALNPSFETGTPAAPILTNIATNPSFETPAGAPTVAATNLATNPSFETAGPSQVLATNLLTNPSVETVGGLPIELRRNRVNHPRLVSDLGGWVSTTPTVCLGPNALGLSVGGCGETHGAPDTGTRLAHNVNDVIPALQGEILAGSAMIDMQASPAFPLALALEFWQSGTLLETHKGPAQYPGTSTQVRLFTNAVPAPTGTTHVTLAVYLEPGGIFFFERVFYVRQTIIEKVAAQGAYAGSYFDGSMLPAGDFTHLWVGTPDASPSTQSGTPVADVTPGRAVVVYSTQAWSSNRARSVLVRQAEQNQNDSFANLGGGAGSGMNYGVEAGKTYTFKGKLRLTAPQHQNFNGARARGVSVFFNGGATEVNSVPTPNVAGVHDFSLTFTVPAGTNDVFFRLYSGGFNAGEEVWFDDLLLVEGNYTGPYFDGSTPAADPDFTYAWTGAPDASASTKSVLGVAGITAGQATVMQASDSPALGSKIARYTLATGDNVALGVVGTSPTQGSTYTVLGKVRPRTRDQLFEPQIGGKRGPSFTALKDVWTDFRYTDVADGYPLENTGLFILNGSSGHQAGDVVDIDAVMLVAGTYVDPYFDGSTPDDGNGNFDWTGVPDASTSTRSILGVEGVPFPLGAEMQQTGDSPAHGAAAVRFTVKTTIGVVLGVTTAMPTQGGTYTLIGKVRPRTRDQAFTPQIRGTHGPAFTAPKDVWTDFRVTLVSGGGAAYDTGLFLQSGSGHQVDDIIDVDAVAVVQGYASSYFDGGTADGGDFTYDWTGAPNVSTSTLSAPGVAHVNPNAGGAVTRWQATESPANRTKIMRHQVNQTTVTAFPVMDLALLDGQPYTMIGSVRPKNRAQVFTPRIGGADGVPFTAPAGVWTKFRASAISSAPTPANTGLYIADASGHQIGDIIDIDAVAVVAGDYPGDYFDGSIPDTEAPYADFEWLGTPDASESTYRTGQMTTVPDVESYEAALARLVRNLHTVTCVSGPIVEQKFHRGETWGYLVEFVLVAAVPWMFGETKPVELTPSLPIVVQDVPFNLVPYPSAELALGAVVAATNLVLNPSVELDTTGWQIETDGGVGGPVLSHSVPGTDPSVQGSHSAKALFTATGSGSGGVLALGYHLNLPPAPPTTRYSANLWATGSIESGTAVLGNINYQVVWMDGAGTELRVDVMGSEPAAGGPKSIKSVPPIPAGSTRVKVRALLSITSWSAGAKIRLYADAAGVTVP